MGSELQPPQISASANCYATTSPAQIFTFISSHICAEKNYQMFTQISGPMPHLFQGYHYANNHTQ